MKKIFIILFLFLGCAHYSFSNDTLTSKIIIFRENSYYGSLINYKIYANDSLIVRLMNNSYFQYNCLPGKYSISVNNDTNNRIVINTEAAKTYYIRLGINTGFWSNSPEILMVDNAMASSRIKKSTMKEISENKISFSRPQHRIGLNFNIGGGFTKIIMFAMANGDESCISFGGGYGIGLKYGYEVNKLLDIAIDANYQYSMLIPYLDNASSSFQRYYISITPSLIIPFKKGETMRFKIGGGYSYYWSPILQIKSSKISEGWDDTWKYENVSGFHACLNFEMNMSKKILMNYGFKYYNVTYKFKSSDIKYPGSGNALYSPNGSGIDFVLGVSYLF
ncbi:MAG: DUF2846 domain-containing protein [Bacteroidetes bacterium]|nr:DUF2846 domain-containing protein [Bacteroidota bacterium]